MAEDGEAVTVTPEDGETVTTPVTVVTDTDTGVIVVGYPPDTSTGVGVTPGTEVVGDPQEPDGGMGEGD